MKIHENKEAKQLFELLGLDKSPGDTSSMWESYKLSLGLPSDTLVAILHQVSILRSQAAILKDITEISAIEKDCGSIFRWAIGRSSTLDGIAHMNFDWRNPNESFLFEDYFIAELDKQIEATDRIVKSTSEIFKTNEQIFNIQALDLSCMKFSTATIRASSRMSAARSMRSDVIHLNTLLHLFKKWCQSQTEVTTIF